MSSRKRRTRRLRRQVKQFMKHGAKAKPTHKRKTGRTGAIHSKYLRTLQKKVR